MSYNDAQAQYSQLVKANDVANLWNQANQGNANVKTYFGANGQLLNLRDAAANGNAYAKYFMGQVTDAPSQGSTTGTQVATQSTPSSVKSFATNNQQPTYVATKTNNGMKTLPQTGNANGAVVSVAGTLVAAVASMFGIATINKQFN